MLVTTGRKMLLNSLATLIFMDSKQQNFILQFQKSFKWLSCLLELPVSWNTLQTGHIHVGAAIPVSLNQQDDVTKIHLREEGNSSSSQTNFFFSVGVYI